MGNSFFVIRNSSTSSYTRSPEHFHSMEMDHLAIAGIDRSRKLWNRLDRLMDPHASNGVQIWISAAEESM